MLPDTPAPDMITDDFTDANPGFRRTTVHPRLPPPVMVHGGIVFQHPKRKPDPVDTIEACQTVLQRLARRP